MAEDIELTTPAGNVIKIKDAKSQCVVFSQNRPEIPRTGERTMEQPVPSILFIGPSFKPVLAMDAYALVPNKNFRLQVPYRHGESTIRHLTLACSSGSDQFPVYVSQKDSVKSYLAKDLKTYRFIVTDESTPRIDLVTLKSRNAESQILVLHPQQAPEAPQAKAGVDPAKIRANDLLAAGMAGESAQNAVFIARVHLRNLDLLKIRELIMERPLASEEMMFIRTFLQIMIKNEHKKTELDTVKVELQNLDEICRLASLVESGDRTLFDIELDKGISALIAKDMTKFVAAKRSRSASKDEEILFWEWEYRLTRMAAPLAE